mgnify:CR=1 FL=1
MKISQFLNPDEIAIYIINACKKINFSNHVSDNLREDTYLNDSPDINVKFQIHFTPSTPDGMPYYNALPIEEVFLVKNIDTVLKVLTILKVDKSHTKNYLKYRFDKSNISHKKEYFGLMIIYPKSISKI